VRLSPKSIFIGLVALGLPVAVTVGWQLATPATRSSALAEPGGAGGLGKAPARPSGSTAPPPAPRTVPARLTSTVLPARPASASPPPGPPVATDPPRTPSVSPTEASVDPLATLTAPPVPTPTEFVTMPSPPPAPSATAESSDFAPDPTGP